MRKKIMFFSRSECNKSSWRGACNFEMVLKSGEMLKSSVEQYKRYSTAALNQSLLICVT